MSAGLQVHHLHQFYYSVMLVLATANLKNKSNKLKLPKSKDPLRTRVFLKSKFGNLASLKTLKTVPNSDFSYVLQIPPSKHSHKYPTSHVAVFFIATFVK